MDSVYNSYIDWFHCIGIFWGKVGSYCCGTECNVELHVIPELMQPTGVRHNCYCKHSVLQEVSCYLSENIDQVKSDEEGNGREWKGMEGKVIWRRYDTEGVQ